MKKIDANYIKKIWENKPVRQNLAYENPLWFSLLYLRHYFTYPLAPFHVEMFHLIENPKYNFVVVMAFRESGKSTVMNLANILWSILGKPRKKCVIIVSQTQEQAKNHFTNIKSELMNNELLKEDFGPFTENINEWNKLSLELEYHGTKIICLSRDQAIRGIKHNQYRPDLIIYDDPEDSTSIKDEATSEEFAKRFENEILPLGNENTKIIILGNLVTHYGNDPKMDKSFILQLRKKIEERKIKGIFRAYPLIDDNGKNLWPSRFPNHQAVLKLRQRFSLGVWIQEYLLKSYGQDNEEGPNIGFETSYFMQRLRRDHPGIWGRNSMPAQKALVPQMRHFVIRAPMHAVEVFKDSNDPEYLNFLRSMCFYLNKEDLEKRIEQDKKER